MTTDRRYRPARTIEEALEELLAEAGTQFNPLVVRVLTRILARSLAGNQQLEDEQPQRRVRRASPGQKPSAPP